MPVTSHLSLSSWWRLSHSSTTILRFLEYEQLHQLNITGTCLDIGGGSAADYMRFFSPESAQFHSINISAKLKPSCMADVNDPLPLRSDFYTSIISFNTLEHIYRDQGLVREIYRVLQPGGKLYLLVPFLFQIHGSPSDYHRHPAPFWEKLLVEVGFAPDHVMVVPLSFGPLATPLSLIEFVFPRWIRVMLRLLILGISLSWTNLYPEGERSSGRASPLGYYIVAEKSV